MRRSTPITSHRVWMEAACTAHTLTAPTAHMSATPMSVHIWLKKATMMGITRATLLQPLRMRPWHAITHVTGMSAVPRQTFSHLCAQQRQATRASSCVAVAKWLSRTQWQHITIWKCMSRADNPTPRTHPIRTGF